MVRSSHPHGSGRDARTPMPMFTGPLRGARWITRSTPERLIRVAVEFLEDAGFEQRHDGFDEKLRGRGSEWTAVALEIGDEEKSKRRALLGLVIDELPFPVPRAFQRVLSPTLAVVASRPVGPLVSELIVFPHTSRRGAPPYSRAAAPRVRDALEQITAAAGLEGAMLSHESLAGVPDDGSPVSQAVVREVLGWH
ncbi:hypothetical protein BEP68_07600 [Microbacterium sp. 4-7]|nr:hypothetical protein [Microbacterium sp. 4-7]